MLSDEVIAFLQDNPDADIHRLRAFLSSYSPFSAQPVDRVLWVPIDQVQANDYNPNSVARTELALLYLSIKHDGYTQPVVTVWDAENKVYVIVDGFHRYFVLKSNPDLYEWTGGMLPIVVLDKPLTDRMASTVRHNRARGKHSVAGMSNMVFSLLEQGWNDAEICNELGMEPEELLRLKHITGFSKLFANTQYKQAWMSKRQVLLEKQYGSQHTNGDGAPA